MLVSFFARTVLHLETWPRSFGQISGIFKWNGRVDHARKSYASFALNSMLLFPVPSA